MSHNPKERDTRKKKGSVKVDMNPMVDLAFLLLTFFMMATTFSKPQAMELVMPADTDKEEIEQPIAESKVVSIVLDTAELAYIYIGITEAEVKPFSFSAAAFREELTKLLGNNPELTILIKPREGSAYGHTVDVIDELNQMGLTKYVLMDPEDYDVELINKHYGQ